MARDYAQRQNSQRSKIHPRRKPAPRRRPASKAKSRNNTGFNAPSFSAGAVFGAALVLVASYAPEIFQESVTSIRGPQNDTVAPVTFEFDRILENDVVLTDPDAYPAEFAEESGGAPPEYMLQAASFPRREDAEALRANLLMLNLPVQTNRVEIASGIWFRVTVGPFDSQVKARRALTRLRENNLSAQLYKRG